jgi:uncharacterized membrane protein
MSRSLSNAGSGLALLGGAISTYLAYVHFTGGGIACPTTGCERVQQTFYATPHGIPLPVLGLILFAVLVVLIRVAGTRARVAETGLALGGAAVGVYLIGVQVVSLGATCVWCLASDGAAVALAAVAVVRLVRACART